MQLILGMQCVHGGSIADAPERLARLAELVVDPRWRYRFKLVTSATIPLMPSAPRSSGQVPEAKLRALALEALSSPSTDNVLFSTSRKEAGDHADLLVPTGRRVIFAGRDVYSAYAKWRVPLDPGFDVDRVSADWIELQHAIVETLGAIHGVIVTGTNAWVMSAELSLGVTSLDGKLMHPNPAEISSYGAQILDLGTTYIRKPRWGTYLKPAHVAAVGGRDRIVAAVEPAVIRDVGELLYVQLTERVSDATGPEARARYRAFVDLVAPITMPPLPP